MTSKGEIERTSSHFKITFRFNPVLLNIIRGFIQSIGLTPGQCYRSNEKSWNIPLSYEVQVLVFAEQNQFTFVGERQAEKDFVMPEMPELTIDIPLLFKPFPYQQKGIAYLIEKERCICGDQMGLGKTFQTIGAIEGLKVLGKDATPSLIICPASLKINWQREVKKWTGKNAVILDSRNIRFMPQLIENNVEYFITNYEILKKFFVAEIKESKKFTMADIVFNGNKEFFKSVIIDESHRIKSYGTLQTKLCKGVSQGKKFIYLLTGTPVVNKPMDLSSQLGVIDQFHRFGGYKHFNNHFCAGKKQASNLKELQYLLKTYCFYRREKTEVMKDLPPKMRQNIICALDREHWIEYQEAERNLIEYLKNYKSATDETIARSMRGEVMVRIGILKNISARGKLRDVYSFIDNMVESGEKLIVFAHLKEIFVRLMERYPHAVKITGGDSQDERQLSIDRFQNDPKCKLIFCSIKAAGVGITLTASSQVGFIEMDWTAAAMEQCEDRAHRIGQQDNVTCTYFIGDRTIDQYIYEVINRKRAIANEVTGGENNIEENVIEGLMNIFLQKEKTEVSGTIIDNDFVLYE